MLWSTFKIIHVDLQLTVCFLPLSDIHQREFITIKICSSKIGLNWFTTKGLKDFAPAVWTFWMEKCWMKKMTRLKTMGKNGMRIED